MEDSSVFNYQSFFFFFQVLSTSDSTGFTANSPNPPVWKLLMFRYSVFSIKASSPEIQHGLSFLLLLVSAIFLGDPTVFFQPIVIPSKVPQGHPDFPHHILSLCSNNIPLVLLLSPPTFNFSQFFPQTKNFFFRA